MPPASKRKKPVSVNPDEPQTPFPGRGCGGWVIMGRRLLPATSRPGQKKAPGFFCLGLWKSAASYSPTWCRSTIGAGELNFSVRDGKRWILTAITA